MTRARGLRFECTGCGGCCTARGEYAHVYLNPDEAEDLAGELAVSLREFRRRYTFVDEYGYTQLRFDDSSCVFLERDTNRCTVYGARPTQCRTFPFWRDLVADGKWTPEARELCEGVGRGPSHTREYAEARMREMELADET
ncbi:MAG TPA: YkgJ family cysteine cluster protein [Myxococcota bacterium]|nr:YkgJ family cysteine cluster protein [Myxococcota bacterium]